MHFLLFALLFLLPYNLLAEGYSDTPDVIQKQLYLTYEKVPKKIYISQVFSVTIKALSTEDHFENIDYTFSDAKGVKLLSSTPKRIIKGRYFYDTFTFLAKSHYMQLPKISASVRFSSFHTSNKSTLTPLNLIAIKLRDTKDFSHVIAKNFLLNSYKTTRYSHTKNIILFSAQTTSSDLSTFKLNNAIKQGFESLKNEYNISTMTYYAVIKNDIENLKFTYFNSITHTYEKILIPIIVEDDSVSTQSNLSPQENEHRFIKIAIASIIIVILILLYTLQKRMVYLLLLIAPLIYIALTSIPLQTICIKKGTHLHILPMLNSTLFETTHKKLTLEVLATQEEFTKIKILDKIGWIHNDDICKN